MAEPAGELPSLPPEKPPAEPPAEIFAEPLAEPAAQPTARPAAQPAAQPAAANQVIASFWCFLFGLPVCTRIVLISNVWFLVLFV